MAAAVSSLPLLMAGLFAFGAATACGSRPYAAADLALPEHRGRDLSLVVWATTIGSVLGPNLAGPGDDLGRSLGLPPLGGAFAVSAAAFGLVSVAAWRCSGPTRCCSRGGGVAGSRATRAGGRPVPPCVRCGPHPAGVWG